MIQVLAAHPVGTGLTALWLFASFVAGMPDPCATSSFAYRWAYASLHAALLNLLRIVQDRFPRMSAACDELTPNPSQGRLITMPAPPPNLPPAA